MINKEVKGQLARLLATENIMVEHRNVKTASFDVENRLLVLPMWDAASQDVYDLLVGHEVGHALYTPADEWELKEENKDLPKFFVNVTEDARVEKLMKRKYPGLSANFYRGYRELNDEDFFGIADEPIENISFIDRVNLHFKVGIHTLTQIEFSEEEKEYISLVEKAETFGEAVDAARAIFKYAQYIQTQTDKVEIVPDSSDEDTSPGNNPIEIPGQSQNSQQSKEKQDGSDGNEKSQDESESSQSSSSKNELESKTDEAWNRNQQKLTSNSPYSPNYVTIPEVNSTDVIINAKYFYDKINEFYQGYKTPDHFHPNYLDSLNRYRETVFDSYKTFRLDSQKEVNYLVKEFEMKKSADQYNRASVSRTGVLDTSKLHSYRYNEDLFKKVMTVPGAKNHGMIFILDWSGSMSSDIFACIKQIIIMAWFCRKVNIPFEVYSFSEIGALRVFGDVSGVLQTREDTVAVIDNCFRLVNLLSSSSKTVEFEQHAKWLYFLGRTFHDGYDHPDFVSLGNTPLNETVIFYPSLIANFQKRHKVQKMSLITLTDGDASPLNYHTVRENQSSSYYRIDNFQRRVNGYCIFRNKKTGRSYPIDGWDEYVTTKQLLRNAKDQYPYVNFIGIRIVSSTSARHYINRFTDYYSNNISTSWTKNKCVEIKNSGYDSLYVLANGNNLSEDADFDVEAGATKAQIKNAFKKMLKKKTMNKKFLSMFIESIA